MCHSSDVEQGVKEFPLGTVLTVTDAKARFFAPDGLPGVRSLLSYMVGEPVYDNQLPRIIAEVRDEIFRQQPFLVEDYVMRPPERFETETVEEWLGWLGIYAGETLALLPLKPEDHTSIDPRDEWAMKKGTREGIISIEPPTDPDQSC